MSITGKDTYPDDVGHRGAGERQDDAVEDTPGSAAGCMRALSLNGAADASPSPLKLARGGDNRQPPKPDVLDAIRSLMMAPVSSHRVRRKP